MPVHNPLGGAHPGIQAKRDLIFAMISDKASDEKVITADVAKLQLPDLEELLMAAFQLQWRDQKIGFILSVIYDQLIQRHNKDENRMLATLGIASLTAVYFTEIKGNRPRLLAEIRNYITDTKRATPKQLSQFLSCKFDGIFLFDWIVVLGDKELILKLHELISAKPLREDAISLPSFHIDNPNTMNILVSLELFSVIKSYSPKLPENTLNQLLPPSLLYYLIYTDDKVPYDTAHIDTLLSLGHIKSLVTVELVVHRHQWPYEQITGRLNEFSDTELREVRETVLLEYATKNTINPVLFWPWLHYWVSHCPMVYPFNPCLFVRLFASSSNFDIFSQFIKNFDQSTFYKSLHQILRKLHEDNVKEQLEEPFRAQLREQRLLHRLFIRFLIEGDQDVFMALPEEIRTDLLLSLCGCLPNSDEYKQKGIDDCDIAPAVMNVFVKNAELPCRGVIAHHAGQTQESLFNNILQIPGSDIGYQIYERLKLEPNEPKALSKITDSIYLLYSVLKIKGGPALLELLMKDGKFFPSYFFPKPPSSKVTEEYGAFIKMLVEHSLFIPRNIEEFESWITSYKTWLKSDQNPQVALLLLLSLSQGYGGKDKVQRSLRQTLSELDEGLRSVIYRITPPNMEVDFPLETLPRRKGLTHQKAREEAHQDLLKEFIRTPTPGAFDGTRQLALDYLLAFRNDLLNVPLRKETNPQEYRSNAVIELLKLLPYFLSHQCVDIFLRAMQGLDQAKISSLPQDVIEIGQTDEDKLKHFLSLLLYHMDGANSLGFLETFLARQKLEVFDWFSTPQRYCGLLIPPIEILLLNLTSTKTGSSQFSKSRITTSPLDLIDCLTLLLNAGYPFSSVQSNYLIHNCDAIRASIISSSNNIDQINRAIDRFANMIARISLATGDVHTSIWDEETQENIKALLQERADADIFVQYRQLQNARNVFWEAHLCVLRSQIEYMLGIGHTPGEIFRSRPLKASECMETIPSIFTFLSETDWTASCIDRLMLCLQDKEEAHEYRYICLAMFEKNPAVMDRLPLNTLLSVYLSHLDLPSARLVEKLIENLLRRLHHGETLEPAGDELLGARDYFGPLSIRINQADGHRLLQMCYLLSALIATSKKVTLSREAVRVFKSLEQLLVSVYENHQWRLIEPFNKLLASDGHGQWLSVLLSLECGQSLLSPSLLSPLFDFAIVQRLPTVLSVVLSLYKKWGHKVQPEILQERMGTLLDHYFNEQGDLTTKKAALELFLVLGQSLEHSRAFFSERREEELLPLLIKVATLNHVGMVSTVAECLEAAHQDINKETCYEHLKNIYSEIGDKAFKNIPWQVSTFQDAANLVIKLKGADLKSRFQEETKKLEEFETKYEEINALYERVEANWRKEKQQDSNLGMLDERIKELSQMKLDSIKLKEEEKKQLTSKKSTLLKKMQALVKLIRETPINNDSNDPVVTASIEPPEPQKGRSNLDTKKQSVSKAAAKRDRPGLRLFDKGTYDTQSGGSVLPSASSAIGSPSNPRQNGRDSSATSFHGANETNLQEYQALIAQKQALLEQQQRLTQELKRIESEMTALDSPCQVGCNLTDNTRRFALWYHPLTKTYEYLLEGFSVGDPILSKLFLPPHEIREGFLTSFDSENPIRISSSLALAQKLEDLSCMVYEKERFERDRSQGTLLLIGYTDIGSLPVYRCADGKEFILFARGTNENSKKLYVLEGKELQLVSMIPSPTTSMSP